MKSTIGHGKTLLFLRGFSVLYNGFGQLGGLQVIHTMYEILGRGL